jgi:hypothetical protein
VRTKHLIRLVLTAIGQAVVVAGILVFNSYALDVLASVCAVAAMVLPFVGYIAAAYDAPLLAKWPRALKTSVLAILSIVVTLGGYIVFTTCGFLIRGKA